MTRVWCVRADGGRYTEDFLRGRYIGIGWDRLPDLRNIQLKDELYNLFQTAYPDQVSPIVIGNNVGQVGRFLLDIQADDYVITPSADTEWLHSCRVEADPSYFYSDRDDGCPDPAPNLPSLISRIFSGYGPNWGGLQTRWV